MNLYTDIDPKCCAWTQELIKANLIPPGDVLCKSILDIKPHELEKYTQVHLFCGIAGWPYALRLAGWPDDRPVWSSSLPCQSFSSAGKGKGFGDDRGNLWFPFLRLVRELRPGIILGEQVQAAIGHGWLDRIFTDLEAETYACGACVLGAHSAGAPHIRQRLFWVAHAGSSRTDICAEKLCSRNDPTGEPSSDRWLADNTSERLEGTAGASIQGRSDGSAGDGAASGLENSQRDGWRERATSEPGQESGSTLTDDRGAASGMGHADEPVPQGRREHPERAGKLPAGADGASGGRMGNAKGRSGHGKVFPSQRQEVPIPSGDSNFWSHSRWHACRDGKARRVPASPGFQFVAPGLPYLVAALRDAGCQEAEIRQACDLFPLAKEKITGRVMLLRGAGNSIVPQVAAEFVKAAAEAIDSLQPAASASRPAEPAKKGLPSA